MANENCKRCGHIHGWPDVCGFHGCECKDQPNLMQPIDVPLIEREKQELVDIIGRLKEELAWYVAERNRLIAEEANGD